MNQLISKEGNDEPGTLETVACVVNHMQPDEKRDESQELAKTKREDDSTATSSSSNKKTKTDSTAEAVFNIGSKRKVTVGSFKGTLLINIREFYEDRATGVDRPGNKGIALSVDQWKALQEQMTEIDSAVDSCT